MVDVPTFALQQDMQSTIAVANAASGKVTQAHAQGGLILGLAAGAIAGTTELQHLAGTALADGYPQGEAGLKQRNELTPLGRLQNFF